MQERVHRLVGDEPDIATAPPSPPEGPRAHKLFPAKGSHAVTAMATGSNLGAIDEH